MSILYVNAPAFAVAVGRIKDPSLSKVPIVVGTHLGPQSPIISVSPEAYSLGVRKGWKLIEVKKFDRHIKILPSNPQLYQKAQNKMLHVVQHFTPIYESERLGSFFLNMEGTERLFGKTVDVGVKIQREIARNLGLTSTVGAAGNKLVSRIAAKLIRPKGLCDVFPGNEASFIAPLEVEYLPALKSFTHKNVLRELALIQIRDVAEVPTYVLTKLFGRRGEEIKSQAQGIDCTYVELPQEQEIISEEILLPYETNDDRTLLSHLWEMVEKIGRNLRGRRIVTGCALLQGYYIDRKRVEEQIPIVPPTNLDFQIFETIRQRWKKIIPRRVAFMSFSLSASNLSPEFHQTGFLEDMRESKLLITLDHLREKYGMSIVRIPKE